MQDDLAPEVVADLDVFLVLVGRVVYLVVALGLEEEVSGLPADHGHQPANQRRSRGILEDQAVGGKKAERAQEVEGLINAAVMIVAVIVPPLDSQSFEKTLHAVSFPGLPAPVAMKKEI